MKCVMLNEKRAKKALTYGIINEVFNPNDENIINELFLKTNGGFDCVIECCGNEIAVDESVKLCKSGKTVVLAGVSLNPIKINTKEVVMREINLQGTICYTKEDFIDTMKLIENKTVKVLKYVTSNISINEVQESFEILTSGNDDNAKIMINY